MELYHTHIIYFAYIINLSSVWRVYISILGKMFLKYKIENTYNKSKSKRTNSHTIKQSIKYAAI